MFVIIRAFCVVVVYLCHSKLKWTCTNCNWRHDLTIANGKHCVFAAATGIIYYMTRSRNCGLQKISGGGSWRFPGGREFPPPRKHAWLKHWLIQANTDSSSTRRPTIRQCLALLQTAGALWRVRLKPCTPHNLCRTSTQRWARDVKARDRARDETETRRL